METFQILAWIFAILVIIGIGVFIYAWPRRHRKFIDTAESIEKGMSLSDVKNILGEPTSEEEDADKLILIWEKNQWRGMLHGGTTTRAIKIVFLDNKVISIARKNLDKSTFW